ncbi:MAG: DUF1214 domain-containing protein [Novosphingobium sp.]
MKHVLQAAAVGAALFGAAVAGDAGAQTASGGAPQTRVAAWDRFTDGIRDLPSRMLAKLPVTMREDPRIQQEIARLALASVSMTALDMLANDGDHPAFVPAGNLVLNVAEPNPDTIYRAARITPGGSYRIRGRRGSLRMVSIGQAGPLPVEPGFVPGRGPHTFHDLNALKVDAQGRFDVLLSARRPDGYKGDWWPLEAGTSRLVLRMISSDWTKERDPTLSIERVDAPVRRLRSDPGSLARNLEMTAKLGSFMAIWFVDRVEQLRGEGYVNKLKPVDISQIGGLAGQSYYEGAYELGDDEALLVEVKAPTRCEYRSLIVTNEIFETVDWINNQSSLNDSQAKVDPDGMLRLVVSSRDPGVPNWVDTAGHSRGVFQGRWTNCDTQPTPSVRKVAVSEVRRLLPTGTPVVTPEQRERLIRERRAAYQQRPLW